MSAGMPELGSKISLISKADIRYEGRLFTVDPQECTIALANVRSFGTEDRDTPYPIMPQPTVYDYILFRGSDIKDIRVVNNVAIPNDPAIMQMHLPPSQMPPQQNFPPQNFPPMQGQPGGAGPQMGQFGPFGGMQGGNMGMPQGGNMPPQQQSQSPVQQGNNSNNLAPGSGSGQKNKKSSECSKGNQESTDKSTTQPSRKQSNKSQDSRSGTPQNSRKSPTSDAGIQNNQNQRGDGQAGGNKEKPQRNNQRNNQQQQRERRDSGRNENQDNNKGGYRNQNQNRQMNNNNNNQQQNRGYNNRDNRDNRDSRNGGNNNGNNQMRQGGSARMRGPPMNNYRQQQQNNQGVPNQNKPNTAGQQQQNRGNNKQTKFDSEFDFEQANSKFEEFRSQFAKLKVGSEDPKVVPEQVNGEAEKKDDSGNETGADNHEAENDETAYDKNKSFFDNISCEAVERSKGKTQRTDWRQERKINSETFGYSGFGRRGNYRGRGGYYQGQNYQRGQRQGGYRGPNPNGYRPMRNNYRGNNANNGQANGQQQSQNPPATVNAN